MLLSALQELQLEGVPEVGVEPHEVLELEELPYSTVEAPPWRLSWFHFWWHKRCS